MGPIGGASFYIGLHISAKFGWKYPLVKRIRFARKREKGLSPIGAQ